MIPKFMDLKESVVTSTPKSSTWLASGSNLGGGMINDAEGACIDGQRGSDNESTCDT